MRGASILYPLFAPLLAVGSVLLSPTHAAERASLFERIGGEKTLVAVVDDYVDVLHSDPRTARSFEGTNGKRIKTVLTRQLCDLTGGQCKYDGDSMRDVHAGHRISQREFLSGVELLREVLVKHGIAIRERNELLSLLAPMQRDVVQP